MSKKQHTVSTTLSFKSDAALAAFSVADFAANEHVIKRARKIIKNNLFIFFFSRSNCQLYG